MKRSIFLMLIVALAAALVAPGSVKAQNTSGTTTWTSSIYYYNPTETKGELVVTYYDKYGQVGSTDDDGTKITVDQHGSGEIYIGEVYITGAGTSGFKGSAVLSSSVQIVAIYEQAPNSGPNYSRLLYSAFDVGQASNVIYVPAISRDTKGYMTQVGVQNTGAVANINVDIYNPDGNKVASHLEENVSYNYIFQPADLLTGVSSTQKDFSAVITVTNTDGTTDPKPAAVAAVEDLQMSGRRAYAYEGVTEASSDIIFMPSFTCKYGHGGQTTYYSIQNVGTEATGVTIRAYNESGSQIGGDYKIGNIKANGKATFNSCWLWGKSVTGWATIESTAVGQKNPQPLAVVGKSIGGDGLATAFTGKLVGSNHIYLPYVLWTNAVTKGYSSTIGIMNGGDVDTTATVTFYRNDNKPFVYTVTIPKKGRVSIDPKNTNGLLKPVTTTPNKAVRADGSFRGAAEIVVDGPANLISIVRMERRVSGVRGYAYFGEDYTGIPSIP